MEKTTKKRKKTKGARKRIGIIAVGGLSLVLTICLSVGATLAWFAGSTWSSNQMYMGGPVYVEMAGAGTAAGDASNTAQWKGGAGNLQIQAATQRQTGTVTNTADGATTGSTIPNNILLPGQKFEIYSQARVFSTASTSSVDENVVNSQNSGGNVTNTSKDGTAHITDKGRVTSTTTSVLRARFSVSVEFDPTVGFNNFTDASYRNNYPVQSGKYTGDYAIKDLNTTDANDTKVVNDATPAYYVAAGEDPEGGEPIEEATDANTGYLDDTTAEGIKTTTYKALTWQSALTGAEFTNKTTNMNTTAAAYDDGARRDFVDASQNFTDKIAADASTPATATDGLMAVRSGAKKSIYKWKFVSEDVYNDETLTANALDDATDAVATTGTGVPNYMYAKMPAPFDGSDKTNYGKNGYYGVWILSDADASGNKYLTESDSFYKARCNSYIDSYVEEYITEYGEIKTRKIGESLKALENSLNQSFVNLVNDSSDAIIQGKVFGMEKTAAGKFSYVEGEPTVNTNASWLYIDPTIGNDTNTNEMSTSTGGWWYLVEGSTTGSVTSSDYKIHTTRDNVVDGVNTPIDKGETAGVGGAEEFKQYVVTNDNGTPDNDTDDTKSLEVKGDYFYKNKKYSDYITGAGDDTIFGTADDVKENKTLFDSKDPNRLYAKLYEINPLVNTTDNLGMNGTKNILKVVSYSFPFVNGTSALPGDALTNVFANAKITIQISFQALQAFFPYSSVIDNMTYTNPLLGTAKALNIMNAIPIFNEAFDYQESLDATNSGVSGL